MIDISGRAVRAGIRSVTAVATASCFAVMPQVTNSASAQTGDKGTRAHDHTNPHRDHDGRERRDHGRADLVVDTEGPRGAIVPGNTYKWPFEITNRGSVPARDVSLTAKPDKNLKVLAAPPKCHQRRTGLLVCKIGLLPQGATKRGTITATVVPKTRGRKTLSNPVQVSWQNSPTPEKRMAAFPPVAVSPNPEGAAAPQGTDIGTGILGAIPYPLTVTEHGPVTAESVVVRSPIGLPALTGPCANKILPAEIAGKSSPIKPVLGACGAKEDHPAACGCAGGHDRPAVDRPAAGEAPNRPANDNTPATVAVPDEHAAEPGRPEIETDRPRQARPAPCGAAAAKPVDVPGRPVVVPDMPAIPPCAQHGAGACGCLNRGDAPLAPATEPVAPAAPAAPVAAVPTAPAMPGRSETAPCSAGADKPMGKAASEEPRLPSCAVGEGVPAAAHQDPAALHQDPAETPDTIAPMTPLTGPGKAAHHPLGRPHHPLGGPRHHAPLGRPHGNCYRQGTGFVCPLGAAPHGPHVVGLTHPHGLHCGGSAGASCHIHEARPVAVRQQPTGGRLPLTGSSSALLALSGIGLAGAGAVLYRLSRTRRSDEA